MRFKNFTLLLGALLMLSATSQAANVAFGKKVYASSNQQPPELAVDDNIGTRWSQKSLTATISGSMSTLKRELLSTI